MAHTALARRYRPRRFSEVATQEHVSETLRRAVAGERVGHAYLFCGPRGVGKTTLARVLAMALNCPNRLRAGAEPGGDPLPPGEPCGECESCRRIWSGTTELDVVEIDAASNRGVEDARDLRSRAMYAPSEEGRFKVYIVDEAHMLTREAWNALLKVLEEPPDRVIFIFATTEPEKIEQTAAPILSRCQRFDFRRVGVAEIVARLREVLANEGTDAPDEALRLVARKADGGMRDALSLTDQVLALADDSGIALDSVRRILGVIEEERFLETIDLLAEGDRAGIFDLVQALLDQGYDLVEYYQGLVDSLRTLLRIRVGGDASDLPEERRGDWEERAGRFGAGDLIRMLGMAAELETGGSLRRSAQPRVLLELLLLRFSYLDRTVEMEELLEALGGEGPDTPPAASGAPGGSPAPRSGEPGESGPGGGPAGRPAGRTAGGGGEGDAPTATGDRGAGTGGGASAAREDGDDEEEPHPSSSAAATSTALETRLDDETLLSGWRVYLETGSGIPRGLTPFLMGAEAVARDGSLELRLSPGPALERLRAAGRGGEVAVLESGLARLVGGSPRIRIAERREERTREQRVSRGEVRAGRLQDLLDKEPGLTQAVEEWDLEIVD